MFFLCCTWRAERSKEIEPWLVTWNDPAILNYWEYKKDHIWHEAIYSTNGHISLKFLSNKSVSMRKLRQKSPRMTRGRLGTVRGRNPRNSSWLHQILSSCCDMMRCIALKIGHPKRKFYLPTIDFEGLLWGVSVIFGWVWWMDDMDLNLKAGWCLKLISIIFPSMIPRLLKQSQQRIFSLKHFRGIRAWTTKAGSVTSAAWHFFCGDGWPPYKKHTDSIHLFSIDRCGNP